MTTHLNHEFVFIVSVFFLSLCLYLYLCVFFFSFPINLQVCLFLFLSLCFSTPFSTFFPLPSLLTLPKPSTSRNTELNPNQSNAHVLCVTPGIDLLPNCYCRETVETLENPRIPSLPLICSLSSLGSCGLSSALPLNITAPAALFSSTPLV